MWVKLYRRGILEITVNTNNGVERKNKDLKHEYLKQHMDKSLTGMVTTLVESFHPEKKKR